MDLKDYKTVKRKNFGPILLEMLKNSRDDYVIMYAHGTKILEIYEHEHYNAAEIDWNTLYNGFQHMIKAINSNLEKHGLKIGLDNT